MRVYLDPGGPLEWTVWVEDREMRTRHQFNWRTKEQADAFAEGVLFVNDDTITVEVKEAEG